MNDRHENNFNGMGPYVNAVCQISRDYENKLLRRCYENFPLLTINVKYLNKSEKLISNRPEIKYRSMGLCVNAVYQISRGCRK
jgi:hypothetical protein